MEDESEKKALQNVHLNEQGLTELVQILALLFVGHRNLTSMSLSVSIHKMGMMTSELLRGLSERIYI